MRARRLRPSFDTLCQRITPSDLATPVVSAFASAVAMAAASAATPNAGTMPGSTTTISTPTWIVCGTPQPTCTNVLQPAVDPTIWVVANQ